MMKKLLLTILFISFFVLPIKQVFAEENTVVNVYFFWGKGCPHCEKEKVFLDEMIKKYPQIKINEFEVWGNKENRELMVNFAKKLDVSVSGVPFTVIGDHNFVGWIDKGYTGTQIEDAITCSINSSCRDVGKEIGILNQEEKKIDEKKLRIPESITVPFLGELKIKNFSLPVLAVVLGTLDGFNPCAMWTLLFLISLLLGMENKKRMWILGSTFIIASASVYFLFMVAWLNLLLFISMVVWVRAAIGLVALAGGGFNLKEYFTKKDDTCKVTDTEKRQKTFARLKAAAMHQSFYLALGGIIILAFAVNLVELICSAGLPMVFTQILSISNLNYWQYYLYILLYIFFFMLDDMIVYIIAMTTLRMTGINGKYSRYSSLVGGVLMLIIGALLILKPEWLMFG